MTIDELRRFIAPLTRRVMLMVSRGTLGPIDDSTDLQRGQVTMLAGETRDRVERVQPFGFSSVPLPGSDALIICVGGNRDHPVVVNVDDRRFRPTGLGAGEVCIYSSQTGHRITLKADRSIEIEGENVLIKAAEKVRLETPQLEVTGEVKDRCDGGGMTMQAMRDKYNAHTNGGMGPPAPLMTP